MNVASSEITSNSPADSGDHADQPQPQDGGEEQRGTWWSVFNDVETGLRKFLAAKLPQAADVEDCLQSVSIAMLKNQTEIPQAARRAWLYRVAANEAAKWWRSRSAADRVLERHAETAYRVETEVGTEIETEETLGRVNRSIENLSENARHVVKLRLGDGKTFQTIADELQLPLGTVLTRMRRAMLQLRRELERDHEID